MYCWLERYSPCTVMFLVVNGLITLDSIGKMCLMCKLFESVGGGRGLKLPAS